MYLGYRFETNFHFRNIYVFIHILQTIKMKKSFCSKFHRVMRDQILFVLTILAVVIGFVVGFGIREIEPSSDVVDWLGLLKYSISYHIFELDSQRK